MQPQAAGGQLIGLGWMARRDEPGRSYLLPPKKPFASRRICWRMNGSGSAPITIAPGWPQGVQQTILAFGVLRGMTVMLGVGFGYPCSTYVPCLFAFRASADEETEMPSAQTSNPSMTDVLLLLAMTMEFLHRNSHPRRETRAPVAGEASRTLLDGKPRTAENIPRKIFRQDALSQEAGGSNCLWTDDTSLWRRHSTSSSATVTLEAKATKHPPAMSNNSKPTKLLRKPNYARHRAYPDDERQHAIDDLSHDFAPDPASSDTTSELGHKKEHGGKRDRPQPLTAGVGWRSGAETRIRPFSA